jgi:2-polyprenyl-3-methyl-5-hydroxy-6-metoxy-1,4-benzoquinol methylase
MDREEDHIRYWDEAAADYCSLPRSGRVEYESIVDEFLGDVSGKRVLDAGCGDGTYSRRLNSLGAIVTGIDGSVEMISMAKRYPARLDLGFEVADLTKKLPFRDGYYDVVLANMVLMDIPRIDVAIAEFARLLVDGGKLVFSITHPCFFCYDWVTDEQGERAHKEISDYLTPKALELNFWGKTLHYHRPLSHYFDVLSQNGFCVDAFKEPVAEPDLPEEDLRENPSWGYRMQVPSFAVIRAIRKC